MKNKLIKKENMIISVNYLRNVSMSMSTDTIVFQFKIFKNFTCKFAHIIFEKFVWFLETGEDIWLFDIDREEDNAKEILDMHKRSMEDFHEKELSGNNQF